MFLAARYFNTYPDWDTAIQILEQLENVEMRTPARPPEGNAQIVFLDALIKRGPVPVPVPGVFILLQVAEGTALYFATGMHLSASLEGAQMAFAQTYLEESGDDTEEQPVTCRIFEFHYLGGDHVLH